jgi:hypothetical protein
LGTKDNFYDPVRPYPLEDNRTYERLMFSEYHKLIWQIHQCRAWFLKSKEMTPYHRHLKWVLERGEDRVPKAVCPHCRRNIVEFYYYEWSSESIATFSSDDVYCKKCALEKIVNQNRLLRFKFSNLRRFFKYGEYNYLKDILQIYKNAFMLPQKITNEIAFKFFKEKKEEDECSKLVNPFNLSLIASKGGQLSLF